MECNWFYSNFKFVKHQNCSVTDLCSLLVKFKQSVIVITLYFMIFNSHIIQLYYECSYASYVICA